MTLRCIQNKEWGGRRKGAGRPSTGRKKRTVYVTDGEYTQIKKLIEELRSKEVAKDDLQ